MLITAAMWGLLSLIPRYIVQQDEGFHAFNISDALKTRITHWSEKFQQTPSIATADSLAYTFLSYNEPQKARPYLRYLQQNYRTYRSAVLFDMALQVSQNHPKAFLMEARELFTFLLLSAPKETEKQHLQAALATTYLYEENPMKAIQQLKALIDENANHIPALLAMAKLSLVIKKEENAAQYLTQILDTNPQHTQALLMLSELYYKKEETKEKGKKMLQQLSDLENQPATQALAKRLLQEGK